jgi:hypothetical protein
MEGQGVGTDKEWRVLNKHNANYLMQITLCKLDTNTKLTLSGTANIL